MENGQKMSQLQTFKDWSQTSSQVASTRFEVLPIHKPNEGDMIVTFKNTGTYRYSAVPLEVWKKSLVTESIGKFINSDIKNKYPFTKLS